MSRRPPRQIAIAAVCATAIAIVVAVPVAVRASMIHYRVVDRASAWASAETVVLARYNGSSPRGPYRFAVSAAIRGATVQGHIRVYSRDAWAWDMIRRARQATGFHRSPLLDRLENAPRLVVGRDYCVLLVHGPENDFTLAVANGYFRPPCVSHRRRPPQLKAANERAQ